MTKIIPITKYIKEKPLTHLMVTTLRAACKKQSNHEPFGQKDLNGSFTALLKREFIGAKRIITNGKTTISWFVTATGIKRLHNLGYTEAC
jgi:hypothetical protein